MGMGVNKQGGGKGRKFQPMQEINITPMVDVMLVLLIIFMVTAPLMTAGVPVNLPKTSAQNLSHQKPPIVVTVTKDKEVFLKEKSVSMYHLPARLKEATKGNKEAKIAIKGDKELSYGVMMEIMGKINQAGYTKVSLISNYQEPAALTANSG